MKGIKKITQVLVVSLSLLSSVSLFASHFFAASITYQYTGTPNTYNVIFKFYRDCSGISAPSMISVCYSSVSCGLSGTITLNLVPGSGQEVTLGPCFPFNGITSCNGGTSLGIEEHTFTGIVTLPQACSDWKFEYEECCRTVWISNISTNGGLYVFTTLNNLYVPDNSSPQFAFPAYTQHCLNLNTTKNFSCTDVDGDSIVYQLTNVLDATGFCPFTPNNMGYQQPFSATTPFSSSTPFVLDPVTGILNFTPDLVGGAALAVSVLEYRNGILISEIHREDVVSIINGVIATDEMIGKVYDDLNSDGIFNPGESGLPNRIIEVNPGPFYYSTNSLGDYDAYLPLGNFIASVSSPNAYYIYTPTTHQANFTAGSMIDTGNDFGFSSISSNVQDLRISLTGFNVRPGFPSHLTLTATNIGTVAVNAIVNINLDSLLTITGTLPVALSSTWNTASWNIGNMQPFQAQNFSVFVEVDSSALIGSNLYSTAEIQPIITDTVPYDNSDELSQLVVVSCDPNYKVVEPSGPITVNQVTNGIYLEYTVYFQNTGTAPAINVIIKDTLHPNFIIPTFEVFSASHNYSWTISPSGMITFTFANINLPDSGANETASHGFIKYRIMPKHNLVFGNKVNNTAYIYFDLNAPVVTNYTSTTVLNSTGIIKTDKGKDILVYPNPTSGKINIDFNDKLFSDVNIELFSIAGQRVFYNEQKKVSDHTALELKNLDKGIYFIQLMREGKVYRTKIVLE